MVNPDLIAAARELSPRRILVTGASGFVGSHLVHVLTAGGHQVTACGRNPYRVPFAADGTRFARVDFTDSDQINEVCRDQDLVYHVGALSSPWGHRSQFTRVNVEGTQNVTDACRKQGVKRMVHVSSTAIHFDFRDGFDLTESAPLARPFACDYAESKAEAERVVQQAVDAGLDAVIIRARAVFGLGDNSLLPRLLEAADQKRLRQIGSGQTRLDLTFIDNLVLALIQSGERGRSGSVYSITNGEPVLLWPFVKDVLRQTGRSAELRTVSKQLALGLAGVAERLHRWRSAHGEPVITRYSAGLLSTSKTFDITAARKDLGYQPIVSMETGTLRTIEALKHCEETPSQISVGVRCFTTGYTSAKAHHAERGASRSETIRFHAMVALLDHPVHGLTLFDTGYSPLFFSVTRRWPYRLYRQMTPVVTHDRLAAVKILKANGIAPGEVRRIVLSHFHADHMCGLIDFPHADVIARSSCWNAVRGCTGMNAVRRAFLPELLPQGFEDRLFLIDRLHGPGFGPFEHCHDLFADGSVRLFDLPGHAAGQMGMLVQRDSDSRVFFAADAVWTSQTVRENLKPTLPFRLLADSTADVIDTQQRLHDLHRQFPDIEILPTHCPEVAARYRFDAQVNEVIRSEGAVE